MSSADGPAAASSTTAAPPQPQPQQQQQQQRVDTFISKKAFVDNSGKFKVVVGHGSVVHPQAVLKPTQGPILIGNYCIIEEGAVIENCCSGEADMRKISGLFAPTSVGPKYGLTPAAAAAAGSSGAPAASSSAVVPPITMVIGDCNHIGARVRLQAACVGDGNVFEPLSSVGIMAVVQDGCHLRPCTRATHDAFLPSFTVIEGQGSEWHVNPAVLPPWDPETDPIHNSNASTTTTSAAAESASSGSPSAPSSSQPAAATTTAAAPFNRSAAEAAFMKEARERAEARSRFLRTKLKD